MPPRVSVQGHDSFFGDSSRNLASSASAGRRGKLSVNAKRSVVPLRLLPSASSLNSTANGRRTTPRIREMATLRQASLSRANRIDTTRTVTPGVAALSAAGRTATPQRSFRRARAQERLPIELRRQLLNAIYARHPFRTTLRDGLTPNQVWGLTKTDDHWSSQLEAAPMATRRGRPQAWDDGARPGLHVLRVSRASASGM